MLTRNVQFYVLPTSNCSPKLKKRFCFVPPLWSKFRLNMELLVWKNGCMSFSVNCVCVIGVKAAFKKYIVRSGVNYFCPLLFFKANIILRYQLEFIQKCSENVLVIIQKCSAYVLVIIKLRGGNCQKCPWKTQNCPWHKFSKLPVTFQDCPWQFWKFWPWNFASWPWHFLKKCPWKTENARDKSWQKWCHGHFWVSRGKKQTLGLGVSQKVFRLAWKTV